MHNFNLSPSYRSSVDFNDTFNIVRSNHDKSNDGYPLYNIELTDDENHYRITVAVAGFAEEELDITLHNNILVVCGVHDSTKQKDRRYLYRGITEHNFEKKFQLAEQITVRDARLENGLLIIDLEHFISKKEKPRRIEIIK
ncbi:Hsp20 family protein [Candidatus Pantoea carbekii]|uniref:IbpA protein n=1 Tax=Candidatus Pantoea carbekii TaxID=1235990 RepID=U3U6Y2_9GAMM|nr:Hsp20 family protein [Candidatus Pantoea carbekii]AKC32285.1 small heat shock protein IbpA [Candidatus Pantoea carbekii]BAN99998.1 IbpA protein [Candidatus Pantoea carbekii]